LRSERDVSTIDSENRTAFDPATLSLGSDDGGGGGVLEGGGRSGGVTGDDGDVSDEEDEEDEVSRFFKCLGFRVWVFIVGCWVSCAWCPVLSCCRKQSGNLRMTAP
jgi:hypothetical protein